MGRDNAFQMPLLLDGTGPLSPLHQAVAAITWSHSLRSALERCARLYYYTYFGANKQTARGEPQKDTLHFLKNVETRQQRAGSILHTAIGAYFRKAKQGDFWGASRLVDFARRIFVEDIAFSRDNPDGPVPTDEKFPPVLLREYHYRHPEADRLCEEALEGLVRNVRGFASSEVFETYRAAGREPGSEVERHFQLTGLPCQVTGVVDLALVRAGQVTVVDWKSGPADSSGNDSLQLAVYALWAADRFSCASDAIQVFKAHPAAEQVVEFQVTDSVLAAARQRVVQDAELMVTVRDYAEKGVSVAFSRCLQPRVCAMCSFERVCYA